jgi:molecular chaperone DnaJ
LSIPAGIDNGETIRMTGKGDAGLNGGPAGDVYVTVQMQSHPLFERDGSDIYCEIPITYAQAVLGAEITVPTIDGDVKYAIPEGTQSGTRFRLRGKGVKMLRRDARGDQYVTVNVEVPKKLSKKQKELLQAFNDSLDDLKNHSKRGSFFDKLKQLKRK